MSSSSSLRKPLRKFSEYDDYKEFYNELRNYLSNIDKKYIDIMDYVEKQSESIEKVTLKEDMGNMEENYMDQMSSVLYFVLQGRAREQVQQIEGNTNDANGFELWRRLHHMSRDLQKATHGTKNVGFGNDVNSKNYEPNTIKDVSIELP